MHACITVCLRACETACEVCLRMCISVRLRMQWCVRLCACAVQSRQLGGNSGVRKLFFLRFLIRMRLCKVYVSFRVPNIGVCVSSVVERSIRLFANARTYSECLCAYSYRRGMVDKWGSYGNILRSTAMTESQRLFVCKLSFQSALATIIGASSEKDIP